MKYLVYNHEKDEIEVQAAKPAGYIGRTHQSLVQGLVPVWHASPVNPERVILAIHTMLLRIKDIPFAEVNSAINQIVATFLPNEYSIAAIGASPKFIKWVLKSKGYNTISIGVSKVKGNVEPTKEFIEYVDRKLLKVTNRKIAVMDYAKSGESLVKIKNILTGRWKSGTVVAIALGVGTDFEGGKYKSQVDFVVKNIPELTKGFEGTTYKNMLGRAKDMKDYATYPKPVPGGDVMKGQQAQFAAAKSAFARAAELGPLNVKLDEEFMEVAESQSRDSDSDGEESSSEFS